MRLLSLSLSCLSCQYIVSITELSEINKSSPCTTFLNNIIATYLAHTYEYMVLNPNNACIA